MTIQEAIKAAQETARRFKRPSDPYWHTLADNYPIFAEGPALGAVAACGIDCLLADDWEIESPEGDEKNPQ